MGMILILRRNYLPIRRNAWKRSSLFSTRVELERPSSRQEPPVKNAPIARESASGNLKAMIPQDQIYGRTDLPENLSSRDSVRGTQVLWTVLPALEKSWLCNRESLPQGVSTRRFRRFRQSSGDRSALSGFRLPDGKELAIGAGIPPAADRTGYLVLFVDASYYKIRTEHVSSPRRSGGRGWRRNGSGDLAQESQIVRMRNSVGTLRGPKEEDLAGFKLSSRWNTGNPEGGWSRFSVLLADVSGSLYRAVLRNIPEHRKEVVEGLKRAMKWKASRSHRWLWMPGGNGSQHNRTVSSRVDELTAFPNARERSELTNLMGRVNKELLKTKDQGRRSVPERGNPSSRLVGSILMDITRSGSPRGIDPWRRNDQARRTGLRQIQKIERLPVDWASEISRYHYS